mmetsp:Transcript_18153/g.29575  ORF Transcript_18153/g.29575 Transcript_18153/m.29575 type:complete len:253 (-) Transcript_18153:169-927(-)
MPKIKVTNISSLVNAEHLKDLFNSFGTIVTMSAMTKDGEAKNGDSQMLTIEFKTADEADAAVSLSGTELGDRPFVVERMKEGGEAAAAHSADANGEAAKGGGGGEKGGEKGDKDDGEKDRKKNDDDDDDASDSDRRSKRRKKKRSRSRRRRSDSRDRGRRRRSSRSRDRGRRRRKRERRRRRRDDSSDDSEEERRRKRNVNPTPTRFWDGFQWHDISAGQPQGLENRPLASQVDMSTLLAAQREAAAAVLLE